MNQSFGRLGILLLFACILSGASGCGGGQSNNSTTPPPNNQPSAPGPAPNFTSTAPAQASEGQTYTYDMAATDPAGGGVTYSLTNAPAGASITGTKLTWVPAHGQGRKQNAVTVKATTSSGGTASQSFNVTTTGNFRGVTNTIYVSSQGNIPVPQDNSALAIAAYIPSPQGDYTQIAGTGSTDGTFTIASLPYGKVWIRQGNNFYWTDLNDIDTSTAIFGRANAVVPATPVTINFNMNLASPQTSHDSFWWYVPNFGIKVFYGRTNEGDLTWVDSRTWRAFDSTTAPLMDSTQGDVGYFYRTQFHGSSPSLGTILTVIESTPPQSLQMSDGVPVSVSDTTASVPLSRTIRANVQGSAFLALLAQINPTAIAATNSIGSREAGVLVKAQPFTDEFGELFYPGSADGSPTLADLPESIFTTDQDHGDIPYGNPFPGFSDYARVVFRGERRAGTFGPIFYGELGMVTTAIPGSGSVITPNLGPVQTPIVDGVNFLQENAQISTTPTFTWGPPALGTAQSYYVLISRRTPTADPNVNFFRFFTNETTLKVPAGLLAPNVSYIAYIRAYSSPNADVVAKPLIRPFPTSWADAFTISLFTSQ